MSELLAVLARNLQAVQNRIASACDRSGRDRATVELIAVTKSVDVEAIARLIQLGQRQFGENRPQQLLERVANIAAKAPLLQGEQRWPHVSPTAQRPEILWHLIGPLQRNKVRGLLPAVTRIHSIDSLRLLERINLIAGDLGLVPRLLLEVNVSGEATKQGFSPEQLRHEWPEIASFRNVSITGLMTMAPYANDPESSRPHFRRLRELRDDLVDQSTDIDWTRRKLMTHSLRELSMGMSGDFEIAIEEGATHIRVGTSLFTGLPVSS